ncbi:Ribonuclease Z, mitochondrial, partial [Armadillidium nasatum]
LSNCRFLFNCGEGSRRICRENKIYTENLTGVFFTSCSWKHISGIPAFQAPFTNNEEKKNIFNLYGPAAVESFFHQYSDLDFDFDTSNRYFTLNCEEIIFKESLVVKPVPLFVKDSENLSPKNIPPKYILAYICTFPIRNGRLCPHKLVSAGVPPGPLVECLKNGTPVKLPNGKVITAPEVAIDSFEASTFIVLEIPTVQYLEALISNSDFDQYKKEAIRHNPDRKNLKVIVHFTPPEIMKDSRYCEWVNSFSPSVSHIVINNSSSCLGLYNSVQMQLRLNHILPTVFPLHRNPGVQFASSEADYPNEEEPLNPVLLTSEYQFDGPAVHSSCPTVYSYQNVNSSLKNELKKLAVQFDELKRERTSTKRNHFPKILFLGTGSGSATGFRNVSGIKIITWVLIAILDERKKALKEAGIKESPNLYILAPPEIIRLVKDAQHHFDLDLENTTFINNIGLAKDNYIKSSVYKAFKSLHLEDLSVAYVFHVKNSFGIALTHEDGWKIVYSGDTMPSTSLVTIGRNCDLLIHEATVEDGLEERAALKRHSTLSQAIKVGKDMNAKFTILTHFSQKYRNIPFFEMNIVKENVGIAFDCMMVSCPRF